MEELFVPYNIALKLREKGFEISTVLGWYYKKRNSEVISALDINYIEYNQNFQQWEDMSILEAPLYQHVINWFFKKHQIHISTVMLNSYQLNWQVETGLNSICVDTQEQAIEEALKLI